MKVFASLLTVAVLLCCSWGFASAQQDTCPMCQFAVQYIDGYLQQNYTQAQIIKQLEVVCALAPEPFRDQCDNFVIYYVPVLINYIIKYEDPQNACKALGLCTSFAAKPAVVADLENFPKIDTVQGNPEDCQICQMLVGFVEAYVQANKTVVQIEGYLNQICRLTPFATSCVQFVNTYTPIIVQYIANDEDPQTVCLQLGICSSQAAASVKIN